MAGTAADLTWSPSVPPGALGGTKATSTEEASPHQTSEEAVLGPLLNPWTLGDTAQQLLSSKSDRTDL